VLSPPTCSAPLEAHEGEGDATGRDGAEDRMDGPGAAVHEEAAGRGEVVKVEAGQDQSQSGEGGDGELEYGDR
jgi:hypothetical protein